MPNEEQEEVARVGARGKSTVKRTPPVLPISFPPRLLPLRTDGVDVCRTAASDRGEADRSPAIAIVRV